MPETSGLMDSLRLRRPPRRRGATALKCMLVPVVLGASHTTALYAQTVEDELMLGQQELLTGVSYSYDSWEDYWEGNLKRDNGNIGTVSTKTALWTAAYGITDRLNVIANVPYVWTHASQGTLRDLEDFQDVTIAGKYNLFEGPFTSKGTVRAMAVVSGSYPISNYTADFLPLSIGTASKRVAGRLTLHFRSNLGWFVNSSAAYTLRDNVDLERPYYYTDDQLFLTNQVEMPNVFDYTLGAGYSLAGVTGQLLFTEQRTRGGGDIRRQDAPFVSNQMDFSRVGAVLMYTPPKLRSLDLRLGYAYTMDGRNVGQAATVTGTVLYRFDFDGRTPQ